MLRSVQDQLKTASHWKDSTPYILTCSQFCKTSINLQSAIQGLFSLIPEAAVHINFAVNFAGFLEHLFCITYDNQIHNRCSKKSRKILEKTPVLESLLNKAAGLWLRNFFKKTLRRRCFPVNFGKFLRTPFLQNNSGRLLKQYHTNVVTNTFRDLSFSKYLLNEFFLVILCWSFKCRVFLFFM